MNNITNPPRQTGLIPRLRDRLRRVRRDERQESRETEDLARRADPIATFETIRMMRNMMMEPLRELIEQAETATWTPAFDVAENGDVFRFTADMPGMRESDIDISVMGNRLQVSGRREVERASDESLYTCERLSGQFTRTFVLPDNADLDHITSTLRAGVLTIVVPKTSPSQRRRITVGSASTKA